MATTKKQRREWIAELVSLKAEQQRITARRAEIAGLLGKGSHRSRDFPGLMVVIARGSGGFTVQWKGVAEALAKKLGLNARALQQATYGFRKRVNPRLTCSVQRDPAKQANLDLRRVN